MPPEQDDDQDGTPDGSNADLSSLPESIRNSPEYRALQAELRKTARQRGDLQRQLAVAREEAERNRAAAEAARQQEQESQLTSVLGQDGIAAWNELAELAATDQVQAARRFAELMSKAQSQTAPTTPTPPATGTEGTVDTQTAPPPPARTVDATAPLGTAQSGPDLDAIIAAEEQVFRTAVERNLNPATRNRVTMKERGAAMVAFLNAAYRKALRSG